MSLSLSQPELFTVLSLPCPAEEGQWHSGNPHDLTPVPADYCPSPKQITSPWTNKTLTNSLHLDPTCHTFIWSYFFWRQVRWWKFITREVEGAALTTSAANPGINCTETLILALSFYLLSKDMLKVEVGNVPVILNIWNSNLKAAFSLNKHLPTNTLNKCPSCAFQWHLKVAQESSFYLSQCWQRCFF